MIRVRHLTLPSGLSAFVRRGANGDVEVFVSDRLEPERARAAVRMALRTFRPASQRAGLLPVPVALALAGSRTWLRAVLRTLHAHLAASTAAAASLAVATSAGADRRAAAAPSPGRGGQAACVRPRARTGSRPGQYRPGARARAHDRPGTARRRLRPSVSRARGSEVARLREGAAELGGGEQRSGAAAVGLVSPGTIAVPDWDAGRGRAGGGVCVVLLGLKVCL